MRILAVCGGGGGRRLRIVARPNCHEELSFATVGEYFSDGSCFAPFALVALFLGQLAVYAFLRRRCSLAAAAAIFDGGLPICQVGLAAQATGDQITDFDP